MAWHMLISGCSLLGTLLHAQVLAEPTARATKVSRDGLYGFDSVEWTAEKKREHIEPLNADLYLDNHGGNGSGQKTAAAAIISGDPSGRYTQRKSERTSAVPATATSIATADVVSSRRPHRLKKGNDEDTSARLNKRRVAEEDEGAAAERSPEFDVDEKNQEVQASSTLTGDTPLVPSFCAVEAFERYAALHQAITEGKESQRYLVYRPYLTCGMGNRMSGFQGALALAVLTNRALLVDWFGGSAIHNLAGKFEDTFLEPHGVPHDVIPPALEGYETAPDTEIWCQMPNAQRVTGKCLDWRMTGAFLGSASWDQIYAANATVVVIQAHNANPIQYVEKNTDPVVVEQLARLDTEFGVGAFGLCAERFLYRARPEFRNDYCKERSRVMNNKFPSVSIHVRTGDNKDYLPARMASLPQDLENFVACATGFQEGLTSIMGGSSDFVDVVDWEHAEMVWPLGTDSHDVIDLLNKANHTVEFGGKVAYIEGDENHRAHTGTKNSHADNSGPLMDMAMLSESVLLVGSYHSSYTLHVAELGGLPRPLRLTIRTPFTGIFGSRKFRQMDDYIEFEDYQQGCRDFVTDPSKRASVTMALLASQEPFIDCSDYSG